MNEAMKDYLVMQITILEDLKTEENQNEVQGWIDKFINTLKYGL